MDIYARAQTSSQTWTHEVPLPPPEPQTHRRFQHWHHFDPAARQWVPTRPASTSNDTRDNQTETSQECPSQSTDLVLVTWNIDAATSHAQERVADIITFITGLDPIPDIVFFQEVSKKALQRILSDERIRASWISSEADDRAWGTQPFATMTLVSKTSALPGPIWRVSYPSYFGRDALFCDLFVSSPGSDSSRRRLRLANVHLDSLALQPSNRPRQLAIVASYLRAAGRGLVAGDFNPVLPEDAALVEGNGLVDVWVALRAGESGFTWGTDGKQRFPPRRMDKVVGLGVEGKWIAVLEAGRVGLEGEGEGQGEGDSGLLWSDHHGLVCSFGVRDG